MYYCLAICNSIRNTAEDSKQCYCFYETYVLFVLSSNFYNKLYIICIYCFFTGVAVTSAKTIF